MKRLFSLMPAFFVTLVIALEIACTHQEETIDTDVPQLSDAQLKLLSNANQVGVNHNRALDYLASNCDLRTVTNEQKFQIISDFYISIAMTDEQKDVVREAKARGCSTCDFTYNSIAEWVKANRNKLSAEEAGYMLEMEKSLALYQNGGIGKVLELLKSLERKAVSDSKLANPEAYLGTSAILRHSLQYWDSAYTDPLHPFYNAVNHGVTFRCGTYCIIYIAIVDALSYYDCLANGGFGTGEVANTVCMNQGAYASAQAY